MPSFDSSVNPLHQIQGLGPVILKVNELSITTSILTRVFGLDLFAEYLPSEDANENIQVFKIGEGGLGENYTYTKHMRKYNFQSMDQLNKLNFLHITEMNLFKPKNN